MPDCSIFLHVCSHLLLVLLGDWLGSHLAWKKKFLKSNSNVNPSINPIRFLESRFPSNLRIFNSCRATCTVTINSLNVIKINKFKFSYHGTDNAINRPRSINDYGKNLCTLLRIYWQWSTMKGRYFSSYF